MNLLEEKEDTSSTVTLYSSTSGFGAADALQAVPNWVCHRPDRRNMFLGSMNESGAVLQPS